MLPAEQKARTRWANRWKPAEVGHPVLQPFGTNKAALAGRLVRHLADLAFCQTLSQIVWSVASWVASA